jgi:hypothetical protein
VGKPVCSHRLWYRERFESQYKGDTAYMLTEVVIQRAFTGEVDRVSLPARPRDVFQLHSIQAGLGIYQLPIQWVQVNSLELIRAAREGEQSPVSSAEVRNFRIIPPLSTRLHDLLLH